MRMGFSVQWEEEALDDPPDFWFWETVWIVMLLTEIGTIGRHTSFGVSSALAISISGACQMG